jgi:hypothetical protein
MKNKIEDLRNHLFATLEALRDPEKPMEIERAQAIANVAKVIVESAAVECKHLALTGGRGTGFATTKRRDFIRARHDLQRYRRRGQ